MAATSGGAQPQTTTSAASGSASLPTAELGGHIMEVKQALAVRK